MTTLRFLAAMGLLLAALAARADVGAWPAAWQRTHTPAGMSLETRGSAIAEGGALAVFGLQRPLSRGKDKGADRGWIGLFAENGSLVRETSFVLRPGDAAVKEVDAFLPMGREEYVVAGQAANGDSLLVQVDVLGNARELRVLGRKRIAFVLRLASGDLVIGGRDGRDLYAAQLRPDGAVVWERGLDRGFDELFLAGVAAGDGVALLEHSGIREQFFMRNSVVGVTLLGGARPGVPSPAFARDGRAGALAAANAGYGLLVDTGSGVRQDLKFVRLNAALESVAESPLLSSQFGLERARLAHPRGGGFAVAALDGSRLVGLRLDDRGAVEARFDSPAGRVFLHPDVVAGDATYVVATELLEREGGGSARKQVYIARFAPAP